ncbi:class I SAM-dependent methyltransferase [Pseudomonadota bacterium]
MKFEEAHNFVNDVPYITKGNARVLYDLIIENNLVNILELGIGFGSATCYMAAALDELGGGKITSVDLLSAGEFFKPSAEEQVEKMGLTHLVEVVRMKTGYNWFLHDEIHRQTKNDVCMEKYNLCIIDGPKNWTIDGAAFFMVDKLLLKDGWLIFDDYSWTYADADKGRDQTDGITHRELSKAEREIPHIREIFELLVKQHPNYGKLMLMEEANWAIAQKTGNYSKQYQVTYSRKNIESRPSLIDLARRTYNKLRN